MTGDERTIPSTLAFQDNFNGGANESDVKPLFVESPLTIGQSAACTGVINMKER